MFSPPLRLPYPLRRFFIPRSYAPRNASSRGTGNDFGAGAAGCKSPPQHRCRPQKPFLAVSSQEPLRYGPDQRADKPFERAVCEMAKRRQEFKVKDPLEARRQGCWCRVLGG